MQASCIPSSACYRLPIVVELLLLFFWDRRRRSPIVFNGAALTQTIESRMNRVQTKEAFTHQALSGKETPKRSANV